jgi:hypothetical protein
VARRKEHEEVTQRQLDKNATRAIAIKVVKTQPEASAAAKEEEIKSVSANKEDGVPVKAAEEAKVEEAWAYKRKATSISAKAGVFESVSEPTDGAAGNTTAAAVDESSADPIRQKFKTKKRRVTPREELDDAVFPAEGLVHASSWNPFDNKLEAVRGREYTLPDFSLAGNQTLAIKMGVPQSSTRWALNLCPPEHDSGKEIMFHMNPRRFRKEEMLVNTRTEGAWRRAETMPLAELPSLFGSVELECNFELIVQVREAGFFVFHNRSFIAYLAHRREVKDFASLVLQLPATDDNENFNNACFHKVWWGRLDESFLRLPMDLEVKSSAYDGDLCNVFVKGLPRNEPDEVRSFLWALFERFNPQTVNLISVKGVAYVRVASAEDVRCAIESLHGEAFNAGEGSETFTLSLLRANE